MLQQPGLRGLSMSPTTACLHQALNIQQGTKTHVHTQADLLCNAAASAAAVQLKGFNS
jgi:hypothetical protein